MANRELARKGKMKTGTCELTRKGSAPMNNAELVRGGSFPSTFVDRTAQLSSMRETIFDKATGGTSDTDFTPGHKRMSGMS